jgi:hypothetical protein
MTFSTSGASVETGEFASQWRTSAKSTRILFFAATLLNGTTLPVLGKISLWHARTAEK